MNKNMKHYFKIQFISIFSFLLLAGAGCSNESQVSPNLTYPVKPIDTQILEQKKKDETNENRTFLNANQIVFDNKVKAVDVYNINQWNNVFDHQEYTSNRLSSPLGTIPMTEFYFTPVVMKESPKYIYIGLFPAVFDGAPSVIPAMNRLSEKVENFHLPITLYRIDRKTAPATLQKIKTPIFDFKTGNVELISEISDDDMSIKVKKYTCDFQTPALKTESTPYEPCHEIGESTLEL